MKIASHRIPEKKNLLRIRERRNQAEATASDESSSAQRLALRSRDFNVELDVVEFSRYEMPTMPQKEERWN